MTKTSTTLRIATVTATGRRYIVNYIDFKAAEGRGVVHCWGEVTRIRPKTRRGRQVGIVRVHGEAKRFICEAVTISEVPNTSGLGIELFEEHMEALRNKGHRLTRSRSGRTVTDHGIDKDHAAKALARELGESWFSLTEADRNALRDLASK